MLKIDRKQTPSGLRSRLDYSYQNQRYRPTLGYNLSPQNELEAAMRAVQEIQGKADMPPKADTMTFEAFVPTYLKRMRIKGRTGIRRNEGIIKQHLLPFFGSMRIQDIRLSHGEDYIDHRQCQVDTEGRRTVADGTIDRECSVLSAIMNLAVDHDYLERNRLRAMPVPKGAKRERVATIEELRELLAKANDRMRRAIVVAINTGLRQGRIWGIENTWIKSAQDGQWLHLPTAMTKTKGNPRKIPLNTLSSQALKCDIAYLHGRRLFDNWATPTSLSHQFQKLCDRCRIPDLTFHDLRHTFATALKALGVDFEMREIFLGHKLPGIVDRYSHDSPEYDKRQRMAITQLAHYWHQMGVVLAQVPAQITGTEISSV